MTKGKFPLNLNIFWITSHFGDLLSTIGKCSRILLKTADTLLINGKILFREQNVKTDILTDLILLFWCRTSCPVSSVWLSSSWCKHGGLVVAKYRGEKISIMNDDLETYKKEN